jgi:hypothetical protein
MMIVIILLKLSKTGMKVKHHGTGSTKTSSYEKESGNQHQANGKKIKPR